MMHNDKLLSLLTYAGQRVQCGCFSFFTGKLVLCTNSSSFGSRLYKEIDKNYRTPYILNFSVSKGLHLQPFPSKSSLKCKKLNFWTNDLIQQTVCTYC